MPPKTRPSRSSPSAVAPTLAAALIVRDEARCIVRCLESVRPWVDRMVVVDTGSRDETPALARSRGAQVHHLPWPDDFSAARNHALALADADWSLVIDADEWIESGGEALRGWCTGAPRLGVLCIHSSYDPPEGTPAGGALPQGRSWIPRLLPRGVRYAGRVHEQPVSSLPLERIALQLGHDGYREAQAAGKRGRNEPLLRRDLQDHPGDPYLLFQLGKDADVRGADDAALDYYSRALANTPGDAGWRHALVVRALPCLGRCGQLDAALDLAERELPVWQDSPDFFFVLGNLLLDRALADPAQAVEHWLPLAATAWERCLAIGERPDLEGSVQGRGSHLARHNLEVLRNQLAQLAA
ncbi:MAG TPA: glycosyltransferase family 2 protein [Sphingobium sp.]|nr:glycosyltransferase family 2 protein [Sphingobium sp.]